MVMFAENGRIIIGAPSALYNLAGSLPGPLAQSIAFRAFGTQVAGFFLVSNAPIRTIAIPPRIDKNGKNSTT